MKKVFILLCLVIFVSACAPGPCDKTQVQEASGKMFDLFNQWQDAYKIAQSTSRIGLSSPVQSLQSIKRQVDSVEVPRCMVNARGYLSGHMNSTIDGFLAFMAQESDQVVQGKFNDASASLKKYTDEITRIGSCTPNCE